MQQQLRAISEAWVGDKDLPEMRFTLGTLDEAEARRCGSPWPSRPTATSTGSSPGCPCTATRVPCAGWTSTSCRRREGGFGPVMEYLIGSSARQFADEGAQIMSLSGAPLAHDYPPDAG